MIEFPHQPYYIAVSSMTFHFHVFNSTGNILDNTTTSCLIHVYNASNKHILIQDATYEDDDFEVSFGSNISDTIGYFSYIFQCSNPSEAGFVADTFEITNTVNIEPNVSGSPLAALILAPMIFGILLLFGALVLDPEEHAVMRIFLMLLSFTTYFMSAWFGVQALVRYYGFIDLQDSTTLTVFIIAGCLFVIVSYFIIYAFYKSVYAAAQKKKEMMLQ